MDENTNTSTQRPLRQIPQKTLRNRITSYLKKKPSKKRLAIVSGVSLGVLVIGVVLIQMYKPVAEEPLPDPVVESTYEPPPPTTELSRLTGAEVPIGLDNRPVTAVMIENSIDARPQAGLQEAGVVFEAIAEGGITRFLALYQTEQPEHIGPIRSARPYYVRWARGFDAAYVHSGGSPEALSLIRSIGVKDMDHGNHPGTFDRVSNRFAPHNVYTSMARLDALRESLGFTSSEFIGFERLEMPDPEVEVRAENNEGEAAVADLATPAELATSIVFNISSARYNTSYMHNVASNTYDRVMAGVPHVDERSGKQISPAVVVALEASYGIHSNGIHSVYGIVGSGVATIFQNGEVIKGTWSKPSDTAELEFLTSAGEPLLLQPGQTWITAIQAGKYSFQ